MHPVAKERRLNSRNRLSGLMPGRLHNETTGRDISCRPVDVSDQGMGVLSSDQMTAGDQLTLTAGEDVIRLQVAWTKPDFGKRNLFRYGLVAKQPAQLVELFRRTGCLEDA